MLKPVLHLVQEGLRAGMAQLQAWGAAADARAYNDVARRHNTLLCTTAGAGDGGRRRRGAGAGTGGSYSAALMSFDTYGVAGDDSVHGGLSQTLTKRLQPLQRACHHNASTSNTSLITSSNAADDSQTDNANAAGGGRPPVGALPADYGIAFPETTAQAFALSASALEQLQSFYGEHWWDPAAPPPLRERRTAFARAIGIL